MKGEQCPRCRGQGEVVTSYPIGGGCFNDSWDMCTACNGTGRAKPPAAVWSDDPRAISELEVEALR